MLNPLQALIYDHDYLALCRALMNLDPSVRKDIGGILEFSFLLTCDKDVPFVEPWENRAGFLL